MINRLKNPGTIIAIASLVLLILAQLGIGVDNAAIMNIIKTALSIGVTLGILNNPTTPGIDNPIK